MARATGGGRKAAGKGTGRKENSVSHAEGGQRGSLSAKKAVQTRPIAVNPDVRRVRFSEHVHSPTAKRGTPVVT